MNWFNNVVISTEIVFQHVVLTSTTFENTKLDASCYHWCYLNIATLAGVHVHCILISHRIFNKVRKWDILKNVFVLNFDSKISKTLQALEILQQAYRKDSMSRTRCYEWFNHCIAYITLMKLPHQQWLWHWHRLCYNSRNSPINCPRDCWGSRHEQVHNLNRKAPHAHKIGATIVNQWLDSFCSESIKISQ